MKINFLFVNAISKICFFFSFFTITLQNLCFGVWYFIFKIKMVFRGASSSLFTIRNFCVVGPLLISLWYKTVACGASSLVLTIQNSCVVSPHVLLYNTKLVCCGASCFIFMAQNYCVVGPRL